MKKDEYAEGHLEQSAPDEAGRAPTLQSAGSKTAATGLGSLQRVLRDKIDLDKTRAAFKSLLNAKTWMQTPASKRSRLGLDWMNFFIADVQTGFGTFIAFYLASLDWSKGSVGLALGAGQIAAVVAQIPGGAITDAITWKRGLAALGIFMLLASALVFAIAPLYPLVFIAEVLHGASSGLIGPTIAAISLGLVGRRAMSSRTGRNYRYAAAGNAVTAGAMGLIGRYIAKRWIFVAAAALCIPALFALAQIRPNEIDYFRARNAGLGEHATPPTSAFEIIKRPKILIFTVCLILFQFADASLLPLVAENLGTSKAAPAPLMTSGLIVAPLLVVVLLAPWVGHLSEMIGRKPLLLIGFAVEAIRAALLAFVSNYLSLVLVQVLGGITSAIVGVLSVLIITDLTTGTGRFNLTRGGVMTLSTIAASASFAATGFAFQDFGRLATFLMLSGVAAPAMAFAWIFLPETKPAEYLD